MFLDLITNANVGIIYLIEQKKSLPLLTDILTGEVIICFKYRILVIC